MNKLEHGSTEIFSVSNSSWLAKWRGFIWIFLVLGVLPFGYVVLADSGSVVIKSLPFLLVMGMGLLMELVLRKRQEGHKPVVMLSDEALESSDLHGPDKRILWRSIEKIGVGRLQGQRVLHFQFRTSCYREGEEAAWLPLSGFSRKTEQGLFDAVIRRHANAMRELSGDPPREQEEELEFTARMENFEPVLWVTYGLILVNFLIWFFTLTQGADFDGTPANKLFDWGGNATSEVQKGEWWRMVSAQFLHSSFLHVAMNMLGLYMVGRIVERTYGQRLFLMVYLGSGLIASAFSLIFSAQDMVSVGASGAVFGVIGALLTGILQNRQRLPRGFSSQTVGSITAFAIYSLANGLMSPDVDNAAHIGGFLGGGLIALILPERFDLPHFRQTFFRRAIIAPLIIGFTVFGLMVMAPQARVDQKAFYLGLERLEQGIRKFVLAMEEIDQEQKDIAAGKLSVREAAHRAKVKYAPRFREAAEDLAQVIFRPGDPREAQVRRIQHVSGLLAEYMGLDYRFNELTREVDYLDPERAERLSLEIGSQMTQLISARSNSAHQELLGSIPVPRSFLPLQKGQD